MTKENGMKYRAANGQLVRDEGLRSLSAVVKSDRKRALRKINCRVTQVSKMLLAVSKIVDAGNDVKFSQVESYTQNVETKEKLPLRREVGVYVLDMEVMSADIKAPGKLLSSVMRTELDFIRPAKKTL